MGSMGFMCRTVDEAATAVTNIHVIDRFRVRADCEARFSSTVVVDAYERLYREVVGERLHSRESERCDSGV